MTRLTVRSRRLLARRLGAPRAQQLQRRRACRSRAAPTRATTRSWSRPSSRDVLDLVPQSTVKVNDVSVGKITDIDLDGETAVVTMELPHDTDLPGQRGRRDPADQPARREVRLAQPARDRRQQRAAGRRRRDRARRHRPQPRGRGGARRAQPAAQRRRRRAAEDDRQRAQPRPRGPRGHREVGLPPDRGPDGPARRGQGRHRGRHRGPQPALASRSATRSGPSTPRSRSCRARSGRIDRQRGDLVEDAAGRQPARRRRRPRHPGLQGSRRSSRSGSWCRCSTKFAESGDAFVDAFHVFLTYPFVDEVVGRDPQVARNLHMGDYTNLSITLDVKVSGSGDGGTGLPTNPPPTSSTRSRPSSLVTRCLRSGDLDSKPCTEAARAAPEAACSCRRSARRRRTATRTSAGSSTTCSCPTCPTCPAAAAATAAAAAAAAASCRLPGLDAPGLRPGGRQRRATAPGARRWAS